MPSAKPSPSASSEPEIRVPRWRIALLGLYTDDDELSERIAIGWALQGERWPRLLEARHFASPLLGRAACACLIAGAWEGRARLVPVVRAMRRRRALWAGEGLDLGACYELAQHVAEPEWDGLIDRAERRTRVLDLEQQAEDLRRCFT